jgi:hypothetical protein
LAEAGFHEGRHRDRRRSSGNVPSLLLLPVMSGVPPRRAKG